MPTPILRTANAWWVQTPYGAARIETSAATTRELLTDRAAIDTRLVAATPCPSTRSRCCPRSRRPAAWSPR